MCYLPTPEFTSKGSNYLSSDSKGLAEEEKEPSFLPPSHGGTSEFAHLESKKKADDLGLLLLASKLATSPNSKENLKRHLFKPIKDYPTSVAARLENFAASEFYEDKHKAKAVYESMHSKYLESKIQSEANSLCLSSSGSLPDNEESGDPMKSSLSNFFYDVTGQYVSFEEDEQESPLKAIIQQMTAIRVELKAILKNVRDSLHNFVKVDVSNIKQHKVYSKEAKERKAQILKFLKFLKLIANPKTKVSNFNEEPCGLSVLNNTSIINTFPEDIWKSLQQLRIDLEKGGFSEQMKALFAQLEQLKEYKEEFLSLSKETSLTVDDLGKETLIDCEVKAYLSEGESICSTSEKNEKKLVKHKKKKAKPSNFFVTIGRSIKDAFLWFFKAAKYLWKTFWY